MNAAAPIPEVLELALSYAGDGFPVFPCCPKTKKPLTHHGFKDATTNEEVIRRWLQEYPDAMLGWPTTGFCVIDVDLPNGPDSLKALELEHGSLPKTMTTRTPSGGTHYIFKAPEEVKNSASGIGLDLDVRGDGGYVILAGSKNAEGKAYEIIIDLPGILTWIVTGAAEWLTSGLGNPAEVQEATADYKSEQSVINNFLESCCIVRADAQVEGGQLFQAFDRWRANEGQRKITQTKFGKMLPPLGFEKSRSGTGRIIYQGLGLFNYSESSEPFRGKTQ